MRKRTVIFIAAFFLFLAGILAGAGYVKHSMTGMQGSNGREVLVRIAPGESFSRVKSKLIQKDLLHSPRIFSLWAKVTGKAARVQAGEFSLNSSWSQKMILNELVFGREALHELRIPEGLAWWETAEITEKAGFCSARSFSRLAANSTFLKKQNIPAPTAEGFLFPDTYLLPKREGKNAARIIKTLTDRFWEASGDLWGNMDFSAIRDKVTLASLVEKESGVAEERRRIAGVFVNRLKRGMRLQCDPTVIYGLGPEFDGNLKRKDLGNPANAYNTYRHGGLPPGPICSPGLESMKAALNPEEHDFLYFVSRGDGTHKFSKTLAEHNRAVRRFQLRR